MRLGSWSIDLARGSATNGGTEVAVTPGEGAILTWLAARAGQVVSRDELAEQALGQSPHAVSRAVDNVVSRLRAKFEPDPARPVHLITVHGAGYRYLPTAEPAPTPQPPVPIGRVIDLGPVRVALDRGVIEGSRPAELSGNEVALLEALCTLGPRDRDALSRHLFGVAAPGRLAAAVSRLRKKLEPDPTEPRFLVTTATGYRLDVPDARRAAAPAKPLFGRADELDRVVRALRPGRRVLLTGPGGIGKTRLAEEVAHLRGAAFVSLRGVRSPGSLSGALGAALDLPEGDLTVVGAALARRSGLLVLDDLDDLLDDDEGLRALELVVRGVDLLATSRGRGSVAWDQVVELGPLSTDHATALYVAVAASVGVALGEVDQGHVRALVEQVEGSPLAVRLLAHQAHVVPPRDQLSLRGALVGDALREVVASSWSRLGEPAARLLSLLSLFASFTLDDVVAIGGEHSLGPLRELRERSLVHPAEAPGRLACWDVVRTYAQERRDARPDHGAQDLLPYVRYLATWGEPSRCARWDAGDPRELEALLHAAPNLERALDEALRWGEIELAAGCVVAWLTLCARTGAWSAGQAAAERVLAHPGLAEDQRLAVWGRSCGLYVRQYRAADAVRVARLAWARADAQLRLQLAIGLVDATRWAALDVSKEQAMRDARDAAAAAHEPGWVAWFDVRLAHVIEQRPNAAEGYLAVAALVPDEHVLSARARRALGYHRMQQGRHDDATALLDPLRRHPAVQADPPLHARLLGDLLLVHLGAGELRAFDEVFAELSGRYRNLDLPLDEAMTWMWRAARLAVGGDANGAVRTSSLARFVLARGPESAVVSAYVNQFESLHRLHLGQPLVALELARAAHQVLGRPDAWQTRWSIESVLALCTSALGDHRDALALARDARDAVERLDDPARCSLVTARLARVLAAAGNADEARDALAEAERLAVRSGRLHPHTEFSLELDRARAAVARVRA